MWRIMKIYYIGGKINMTSKVHRISAASLLFENYRCNLRNNGLLRKAANSDDIIWQQMSLPHFATLISSKSLYLKAYSEYTDYDEIKHTHFVKSHICSSNNEGEYDLEEALKTAYSKYAERFFISCWYNSKELSDVVFKVYTKGKNGIAIGTNIEALEAQIEASLKKEDFFYNDDNNNIPIKNIVSGNIQYVYQEDLFNEKKQLFEPAQVYAPVFLKGNHFKMDNEFRICVETAEPIKLSYNSAEAQKKRDNMLTKNKDKLLYLNNNLVKNDENKRDFITSFIEQLAEVPNENIQPTHINIKVDPSKCIKYIAIKDDGMFNKLEINSIINIFKNCFGIYMEVAKTYKASGFHIFTILSWREILS